MTKGKWILKGALAAVFFLLVMGTATLLLWNWLVPEIFGAPRIDIWQALGLLLLSKILFGGWRGGRFAKRPSWKEHWRQKLSTMSPEERERCKARMRQRWCPSEEEKS